MYIILHFKNMYVYIILNIQTWESLHVPILQVILECRPVRV